VKFVINILATLFSKGTFLLCGFLSGMITARCLGPHDRGILTVMTALPATIWMLSSFGINQANVYYINKKTFPISSIISNSFVIPFTQGLLLCIMLWFTRHQFLLKYLSHISSELLALTLFLVPLMLLQNSYVGVLRGAEKFKFVSLRQTLRSIAGLLLVAIVLIIFHQGLKAIIFGIFVIELANTAWLLAEINKISPIHLRFNFSLATLTFKFGVKSYLQNLIRFLHNRLDLYLIAYFCIPSAVAYYDISVVIGETLLFLPDAIAFVILPKLVQRSFSEKTYVTLTTARISFTLSGLFALGFFFFGDFIVTSVYGPEYADASSSLRVLIPGLVFCSLSGATVPYYTSLHKQKISIFASFVSLVLNMVLNLFLIPRYSIVGAALSTTVSYTFFSLVLLSVFCQQNQVSITDFLFFKKSDFLYLKYLFFDTNHPFRGSLVRSTAGH
jgi:O-antigen/teichoic acid export membrane protein